MTLLPLMRRILPTWPCAERSGEHPDPVITLWRHQDGYARLSPWRDEAVLYPDPVNATCDFIVDLVHAFNADHRDILTLHCAAIAIAGCAVVFPNGYNQGKSTLMVEAARQGLHVFCDDVMPLDLASFKGKALGIQPRLRTPIPMILGDDFGAFAHAHAGPSSDRFQYLDLDARLLAGFGECRPVGGIVILERTDSGNAELLPASRADALKAILLRNFADSMPAADILDGLFALVDQSRLFRLNYSRGDQAIRLLYETFDSQQEAQA